MIRYCPSASVVAVRTFSIKSGLDASTVTPGRTAPDVSLTTPVIVAWATATDGMSTVNPTSTRKATAFLRITLPDLEQTRPRPLGDGVPLGPVRRIMAQAEPGKEAKNRQKT